MKHFCEKILLVFLLTILKEVDVVVANQPAMEEPNWSTVNRTVFLFNIERVK